MQGKLITSIAVPIGIIDGFFFSVACSLPASRGISFTALVHWIHAMPKPDLVCRW
jgi:hypothetical protein